MNKSSILTLSFLAPLAGILIACGSADPEPSSRASDEAIVTHSCMESCNVSYTSCAATSDPCDCYPLYASCTKRCGRKPAFDPPENCNVDAAAPPDPPPPPPSGCGNQFGCTCGPAGACYATCAACIAKCVTPPIGSPCL